MGNQRLAGLLAGRTATNASAAVDEAKEEEQQEEPDVEKENVQETTKGRGGTASKGLPTTGAQVMEGDLQYGGDDDDGDPMDIPPYGHPLSFLRPGRGNRARLESLRAHGRIPPAAVQAADDVVRQVVPDRESDDRLAGDALFQTPLESWNLQAPLEGRSLSPEDLANLAGAMDPLGRPIAVGRFVSRYGLSPIGRSIARIVGDVPGALLSEDGGFTGACARMATLATLALSSDGALFGELRDRAVRVALDEQALENLLDAAGDLSESVPPGPALYRLVAGSCPRMNPPSWKPREETNQWWMPALEAAGQVAPIPSIAPFEPPVPQRVFDPDDPADQVDALLMSLTGEDPDADVRTITEEHVAGLQDGVGALLSAGGRMQVELAAAALASRRPSLDGFVIASLGVSWRACRDLARALMRAREELSDVVGMPYGDVEEAIARASRTIVQGPGALMRIRHEALCTLAAIAERG